MQNAPKPYLYIPPSHAQMAGPRYFAARDYVNMDRGQLSLVAHTLDVYESASKDKPKSDKPGQPRLPAPVKHEKRARAKGEILKALERLIEAAPLDRPEREHLREGWADLRAGREKDVSSTAFIAMSHRLQDGCHHLVPDTIKGDPKSISGLRDKNIVAHLQHMREVYDACADEKRRHQRELTPETTPSLLKLERKMVMTLAMAKLDNELRTAYKMYEMDDSALFVAGRDIRLQRAATDTLAPFEAYMDSTFPKWRLKKLVIPEDWALKGKDDTMTLGELVAAIHDLKTGGELKPYADLLHHIVAKRAYYFKRDLAKAYGEDERHMSTVIGARNKQRFEEIPGENPFDTHQELIMAAYKAKWAIAAHDVLQLMQRYELTLEDPEIAAIEPEKPQNRVGVEQVNFLGVLEPGRKVKKGGRSGRGED